MLNDDAHDTAEKYKMSDLGEIGKVFGMRVRQLYDRRTVLLSQSKCIEELLERFEFDGR